MSIELLLKSVAAAVSGTNLRTQLIADSTAIESEVNRIGAAVDPQHNADGTHSNVSATSVSAPSITLGGVQRSTWPASGSATVSLTDVLANGNIGNIPVGFDEIGINDETGVSSLFRVHSDGTATAKQFAPVISASLPTTNLAAGMEVTLTDGTRWRRNMANTDWETMGDVIRSEIDNLSAGLFNTISASLPTTNLAAGMEVTLTDGTRWRRNMANADWETMGDVIRSEIGYFAPGLLYKADPLTPAFAKTAADTLSIKAGTKVDVAGTVVTFVADTAVTMPTLAGGTDYAVWIKDDATIQATTDFVSAPSAGNWRKIGGFHYGLVAAGTTVAGGSFATTGNGMIWTQADVDKIAGINAWSLWDLKFRPAASDPRGMVLVDGEVWVDIYLASTDTDTNGTSKYNTNIASGTVLPKIPTAFGGNGTTTYPSLNWWVANELARAKQKRLMFEEEAATAFFGVTENQSIDATASTYPTTQRNAGYTSKYGIEQASGHHWTWGQDSSAHQDVSGAGSYKTVTGNTGAAGSQRGSIYTFGTYGLVRVILGGTRTSGANSGSRASRWSYFPWSSSWAIGLRAACDHLISV